ncbi:hypothetical protein GOP47_0027397 [Adiantum capillus-veneris]|nr:hypothetical protein GOP47_0027397 [Adiantum capillus-veneris]
MEAASAAVFPSSSAGIVARLPSSSCRSELVACSTFLQGSNLRIERRFPTARQSVRGSTVVRNAASTVLSPEQAPSKVISKESQRPVYPFTAIVGQEEMKLCLLLNVIDPKIGGVMIMGDRGTGKSTTVRSLIDLLPEIRVVTGDAFNSDPDDPELMSEEVRLKVQQEMELPVSTAKITMVDLPLGATEDRVCGTIDIEKALTEGVKAFEPGLLAKANRGSGNPEEGELRPQLLDRFGMHAQVGTVRDAELRVKIVEERARFDQDPKTFRESYKEEQEKLQNQISLARTLLPQVKISHEIRVKVSQVCSDLNVDGLRGDIVSNRAAKALAALRGREEVTAEDVYTVIPNSLRHRLRKDPLESIDSGLLVVEKFCEVFGYAKPSSS